MKKIDYCLDYEVETKVLTLLLDQYVGADGSYYKNTKNKEFIENYLEYVYGNFMRIASDHYMDVNLSEINLHGLDFSISDENYEKYKNSQNELGEEILSVEELYLKLDSDIYKFFVNENYKYEKEKIKFSLSSLQKERKEVIKDLFKNEVNLINNLNEDDTNKVDSKEYKIKTEDLINLYYSELIPYSDDSLKEYIEYQKEHYYGQEIEEQMDLDDAEIIKINEYLYIKLEKLMNNKYSVHPFIMDTSLEKFVRELESIQPFTGKYYSKDYELYMSGLNNNSYRGI